MTAYHKFYNGFREHLLYDYTWKEVLPDIIFTVQGPGWKFDIKVTCESIETHSDPYSYGRITAQTANKAIK